MAIRMPGLNKAKHNHRTNKKEKKLKEDLINVTIPSTTKKYSIEDLQSSEFIFDGGHINNPSLTPPVHKPHCTGWFNGTTQAKNTLDTATHETQAGLE